MSQLCVEKHVWCSHSVYKDGVDTGARTCMNVRKAVEMKHMCVCVCVCVCVPGVHVCTYEFSGMCSVSVKKACMYARGHDDNERVRMWGMSVRLLRALKRGVPGRGGPKGNGGRDTKEETPEGRREHTEGRWRPQQGKINKPSDGKKDAPKQQRARKREDRARNNRPRSSWWRECEGGSV